MIEPKMRNGEPACPLCTTGVIKYVTECDGVSKHVCNNHADGGVYGFEGTRLCLFMRVVRGARP